MAHRYPNGLHGRNLYMVTATTLPIAQVQQPMGMVYTATMNLDCPIQHIRHSPYDGCPKEQVYFLTTTFQATVDSRFPTWIYIQCPNGAGEMMKGWVGIQHVILLPQSMQPTYISLNARAIVSTGFTQTWVQPSMASQVVGCVVPVGSVLVITGMTTDGQWYRLDTCAWIPRSWLQ
jgi:hypothetical protein